MRGDATEGGRARQEGVITTHAPHTPHSLPRHASHAHRLRRAPRRLTLSRCSLAALSCSVVYGWVIRERRLDLTLARAMVLSTGHVALAAPFGVSDMTTAPDTAKLARLVALIRDHGHEARIVGERVFARALFTMHGVVGFGLWEDVGATYFAVRCWLGY